MKIVLLLLIPFLTCMISLINGESIAAPEKNVSAATKAETDIFYYSVQLSTCTTEQEAFDVYHSLLTILPPELLESLRVEAVFPYVTIRSGKAVLRKDILEKYELAKSVTDATIVRAHIKEERIIKLYDPAQILEDTAKTNQPDPQVRYYSVQLATCTTEQEALSVYYSLLPKLPKELLEFLRIEEVFPYITIRSGKAVLRKDILGKYELAKSVTDASIVRAHIKNDKIIILYNSEPITEKIVKVKPKENLSAIASPAPLSNDIKQTENEQTVPTPKLPTKTLEPQKHKEELATIIEASSSVISEDEPPAIRTIAPLKDVAGNEKTSPDSAKSVLVLSDVEFVYLVNQNNELIASQGLEWTISQEAVDNARSIFEPEIVMSYQHDDNTFLNEDWTRSIASTSTGGTVLNEVNKDSSLALEGLTPLGSQVRLGYTMQDRANDYDLEDGDEYKGFVGVSVIQPLLRDGGLTVTKANIVVSEIDSTIAFQNYRRKMLEIVANSLVAFWDLQKAQEILLIREKSVAIAEQIFVDTELRVATGKMAETELYVAEAGILTRKALLLEARQQQVIYMARLKNYISYIHPDDEQMIRVVGNIKSDNSIDLDYQNSLARGRKHRPEYLIAKKKVKRENVRIDYAKNQTLPRLNLTGSYGLSSIEDNMSDAFDNSFNDEYTSWSVGVELKIPMQGGRDTKSQLAAAEHRKRQAFLEIKSVEVALVNDIESALKQVINIEEQARNYTKVVDLNQKIFVVEVARLKSGKSNSRYVLDKEEDLIAAKESELNNRINHKKAVMALGMMEGLLLAKYNIEVVEVKR